MPLRRSLEALGFWLGLAPRIFLVHWGMNLNPPPRPVEFHTLPRMQHLPQPLFHIAMFAGGSANASYGVNITGQRLPGAPCLDLALGTLSPPLPSLMGSLRNRNRQSKSPRAGSPCPSLPALMRLI